MSGNNFIGGLGENQITDLRVSFYRLHLLALDCIPEFYALVSSPSTRGEDTMLMGRPGDGFYSGLMAAEFVERRRGVGFVPDEEFVVITS